MKIVAMLLCAAAALAGAARVEAGVMYGATAAGGAGELYILNPATGGVVQDIGPTNDASSLNYPVTGLAFHPASGLLYGSTGNSVAAAAHKLVTINPATAAVTVIGDFNAGNAGNPATMTDLAFDSAGNLYGVGSVGGPQLYSINLATGQATLIGGTGLTSTSGGGLTISSGGVAYGTPTSTRFGTYNLTLGTFTNIANPAKPAGGGAYAALSFDEAGTLFGLNLGPTPTSGLPITHIVTINPATGLVTDVGASVNGLDAMTILVPEPGAAMLLLAPAALALRPTRRRPAR